MTKSVETKKKMYTEKAEQCRRLAVVANRPDVVTALNRLRGEFEAKAAKLDKGSDAAAD
jgi:hypothetical protein